MKPGPIVLLTALAMLTAFTGASAAPPKNYTAELRKATQSIQRKQWPQALKVLDGLLRRGIVTVTEGRPRGYTAEPPRALRERIYSRLESSPRRGRERKESMPTNWRR